MKYNSIKSVQTSLHQMMTNDNNVLFGDTILRELNKLSFILFINTNRLGTSSDVHPLCELYINSKHYNIDILLLANTNIYWGKRSYESFFYIVSQEGWGAFITVSKINQPYDIIYKPEGTTITANNASRSRIYNSGEHCHGLGWWSWITL